MTIADATMIAPWAPYREDVFPRSNGRVLLGETLATYMLLMYGLGADQIVEAFDIDAEDDGTRDRTISAARLIGTLLLEGRLTAWARPIGGGQAVEI